VCNGKQWEGVCEWLYLPITFLEEKEPVVEDISQECFELRVFVFLMA
jgi:hypothetical protein